MAEYSPSKIIKDGNTYNFTDATKIPLTGTNALAGSIIPDTDNSYDFGSSTYKIRYVYCNTAYVTNLNINGTAAGDILTHNASEFVDVTNAQTVAGNKTFTSLASKSNVLARGTLPTTNINEDPIFISYDKNDRRTFAIYNYYNSNGDGRVVLYAYNQNTTNYDNIGLIFGFSNATGNKIIYPVITNSFDLGSSTNKWKSFNGINPGALSLSNIDSYISIDTSQWDVTLSNNILGSFTPAVDGWVLIQLNPINADTDIWIIGGNMRTNYKTTVNPLDNSKFIMCYFPVLKGYTYNIYGHNSMPLSVVSIARLYPCQGNV